MTRTVEDAALALAALAGYDSCDPYSLDGPIDPLSALGTSVKGWKIAYTRDFGIFPVDPEVIRVTDEAVKALEAAGAHVEEVTLDLHHSQQELSDVWCRITALNNLIALDGFRSEGIDLLPDHPEDLPPQVRHWLGSVQQRRAHDYFRDQLVRSEVFDAIRAVMDDYRLLVSPTLACLPVDNATDGNTVGSREINGEAIDPLIGWCMTYLINFTGHPAASAPAGLSVDGLPVGLQVVGRRYADTDVLAASAAIERHRPWLDTYRRCAERPLTLA